MYNRDAERLLELLSTFFHKSEIYRKENFIFLNVRGFDTDLDRIGMRLALIIERDSVHEKVLLKRTEKKS